MTSFTAAHAEPPPAPSSAAAAAPPDAAASPTPAEPPPPPLDLLTFHRDNYFLTGFTGSTQVKFQFSAKFDLWPNRGPHALHLAFTEKSRWDIYRPSAPFAENNFNPELFYTFFHHPGRYDPPPGCAFFHERFGFEHESNGEGGARSRSWNRLNVESRFACYGSAKNYGLVTLKVWAPPFGTEDNPDIVRHLGYGQLGLSYGTESDQGWFGDADVTLLIRKGTAKALAEGSLELDARWRPPYGGFWRFTPYLYGQFFTGYGETLLRYDQAVTAIRVGIGLSDRSTRTE